MRPNQICRLLHNKGNQNQNETTSCGLGEHICKCCDQLGLNFQDIQIVCPTVQHQKNKEPNF